MPSYQISPPFYGYVSNRGPNCGPWVIGSNIYVLLDNALLDSSYPTTVVTMMRSADGGATWTSIPLALPTARTDLSATISSYFDSTNNKLYVTGVYDPTAGIDTTGERSRLFLILFDFSSETWTAEFTDPASGPEFLDKVTSSGVEDYPYYRWHTAIYSDSTDIYVFYCADRNTYDWSQIYLTKYNGATWSAATLVVSDDLKNCVPHSCVKHTDGNFYLLFGKSTELGGVTVTGRSYHLAIVDTAGTVISTSNITTEVSVYQLYQTTALKLNNGKLYFVTPTYTTFTASDGNAHSLMSLYHGDVGTGVTFTRYDVAFHLNPNDAGGDEYADWAFTYNLGAGSLEVIYDGANYTIYFTHAIQYQVASAYRPNQSGTIYKVVTDAVSSDTFTLLFTGTAGPSVSYLISGVKPYTYSSQDWLFFIYGFASGDSSAQGTSPYNLYYNQQTWVTTIEATSPSLNFADTLTMYDAATVTRRDTLNFPVIEVPICPDIIVASGACTFIKTIDDDDPILTDCAETIYSEPGGSCE